MRVKHAIAVRLCTVVLIGMLFTILMSGYFQVKAAKDSMYQNSKLRINQVEQILKQNDADIEALKENLREDYIIRAKAAAYILQNNLQLDRDMEELKKVAALLQVDELHLFDTGGTIYSGTEPKYYGYNFRSGEQMEYFLPLLEDTGLELCQDITPNTAEGKMMQYAALWREDGEGIVQIGMEPVRLMEAMEKNELSYLFSKMTTEPGHVLYAVDGTTGEILGSSNVDFTGRFAEDIGLSIETGTGEAVFGAAIDAVSSYCVFRQQPDGMWIGVSSTVDAMYRNIPVNMLIAALGQALIAAAVILLILRYLDKTVIRDISAVTGKLTQISSGNLDTKVEASGSPELIELSEHINRMVSSLLSNTNKLSLIFQNVEIPIAAYEYHQDMSRVLATSRLADILMLSKEAGDTLLADRYAFDEMIRDICAHPLEQKQYGDIYALPGHEGRYVKLKTYTENTSTFGVIIDVTEDVIERQRIVYERDMDQLTGLVSRRAFFHRMDELFGGQEDVGCGAVFMADVDNLKYVNDTYGHGAGDQLLKAAAGLLGRCSALDKIIARLSGDEFVIVIWDCRSEENVQEYLDGLLIRMEQETLMLPDGSAFPVRMSAGYIFFSKRGADYHELLRLADQALYEAKRGGKGRFVRYQEEKRRIP
ncbi:diguanylate cyclase [Lachnotalea sp. AF33-28]|nr:diguanylate cyclase [Lachnotalea sp. AF33-28]